MSDRGDGGRFVVLPWAVLRERDLISLRRGETSITYVYRDDQNVTRVTVGFGSAADTERAFELACRQLTDGGPAEGDEPVEGDGP